MKVLLDHMVPQKLRHHFPDEYEVYTADYLGWDTLSNGNLIRAAEEAAFSVLVTLDQSLCFQQNIREVNIGIVVIQTAIHSNLPFLVKRMPTVLEVLPIAAQGRHLTVFK